MRQRLLDATGKCEVSVKAMHGRTWVWHYHALDSGCFRLRLENVRTEWSLLSLAFNCRRLAQAKTKD